MNGAPGNGVSLKKSRLINLSTVALLVMLAVETQSLSGMIVVGMVLVSGDESGSVTRNCIRFVTDNCVIRISLEPVTWSTPLTTFVMRNGMMIRLRLVGSALFNTLRIVMVW